MSIENHYTDDERNDMEAGIFTDASGVVCTLSTVFVDKGGVPVAAVTLTVGDAPAIIIPIPALQSCHGYPWLYEAEVQS